VLSGEARAAMIGQDIDDSIRMLIADVGSAAEPGMVRRMLLDVTAEVFHRALAGLRSYEWRGVPFAAWLLRIAANAIVDRAKRARREAPMEGAPLEPAVEAEADALDRRADLFRFVNELPADQRRVIIERFVEERSIRAIAARLNRTEGAVKQLQFRALEALRTRMEGADV